MRPAIVLILLAASALAVLPFVPTILQDPAYHRFADSRIIWGVPNFWNVVSNLPFLVVAVIAARRGAPAILVAGIGFTAFGSALYHLAPDSGSLVWDRLPMAVLFMSVFAGVIGGRAGRWLMPVLIVVGLGSVFYWQRTGDLRLYALVQFYPMVAVPLLLLMERRWDAMLWSMTGLYAVAKVLELGDQQIAGIVSAGGHPVKHVVAAGAILCYVIWTEPRIYTAMRYTMKNGRCVRNHGPAVAEVQSRGHGFDRDRRHRSSGRISN